MGQRLQLNKGISRSRSGDDYATDALIERMTRRCRGLTKAEQRAQQAAACERAAEARRRLWYMLMLDAPLRLAEALREGNMGFMDYYGLKNVVAEADKESKRRQHRMNVRLSFIAEPSVTTASAWRAQ